LYFQVDEKTGWKTVKSWSHNAADTDYESAATTTDWIIP